MSERTVVECKVSDCTHHNDSYCTANAIKVKNQAGALANCTKPEDTACDTFEKK